MKVFDLVKQNSCELISWYTNLGGDDLTNKFIDIVKNEATISVNRRLNTIIGILISGQIKNIFELIEEDIRVLEQSEKYRDSLSQEDMEKAKLKSFSQKRKTFESFFTDLSYAGYGALNVSNTGIDKYGDFCIVLKKKGLMSKGIFFVKEDSLKYFDNTLNFNLNTFKSDISNFESVHLLALRKHLNSIKCTNEDKWADLVCNGNDYIEAIVTKKILKKHFQCIRVKKLHYQAYYDYIFNSYDPSATEDVKYLAGDFRNFINLCKNNKLKVEVI